MSIGSKSLGAVPAKPAARAAAATGYIPDGGTRPDSKEPTMQARGPESGSSKMPFALAQLFGSRSPRTLWLFGKHLYSSEKLRELGQFAVWEARYQLGSFRGSETLVVRSRGAAARVEADGTGLCLEEAGCVVRPCEVPWFIQCPAPDGTSWGSLTSDQKTLYQRLHDGQLRVVWQSPHRITGVFVSAAGTVFVTSAGVVYRLAGGLGDATPVLQLSGPGVAYRADAFTETPAGHLWIGEYADQKAPDQSYIFAGYVHHSCDGGRSWRTYDFLRREGVNKHVHLLRWSQVLGGLVLADGDNQKNLWLNTSTHAPDRVADDPTRGWCRVNRSFLDKGGHTAMCETGGRLLFGTDYYGGTNFLVATRDMKRFEARAVPSPYRRAIFTRIAKRDGSRGEELWATTVFSHHASVRSALLRSLDEGRTWTSIFEYDGTAMELTLLSRSHGCQRTLHLGLLHPGKATGRTFEITDSGH